jgi:hypothetical protein
MSVDMKHKRAYVMSLYPGKSWKVKISHMSDIQVTAIYLKMKKAEGDTPEPKKESE